MFRALNGTTVTYFAPNFTLILILEAITIIMETLIIFYLIPEERKVTALEVASSVFFANLLTWMIGTIVYVVWMLIF